MSEHLDDRERFGHNADQYEFCGKVYKPDSNGKFNVKKPGKDINCCANEPSGKMAGEKWDNTCDNDYSPAGHAAWDVFDFAREEKLFYKWYLKAWKIAGENG